MDCTFIVLSSIFAVLQNDLQWPLIPPFTWTFAHHWVTAAMRGAVYPHWVQLRFIVLPKDTSACRQLEPGFDPTTLRLSICSSPSELQLHITRLFLPLLNPNTAFDRGVVVWLLVLQTVIFNKITTVSGDYRGSQHRGNMSSRCLETNI